MKTLIPKKESLRFNPDRLNTGTPIQYKHKVNDHYFLALVKECGPYLLVITNGIIEKTIEVPEIVSETFEIIPLDDEEKTDPLVVPCTVFDVNRIYLGSIYIDQDGTAFIISDIDPFYLELRNLYGGTLNVQAEVFFSLDSEEQEACHLIIPPVVVEQILKEAVSYKEENG